jgi:arylsulfatase A-like enzyme
MQRAFSWLLVVAAFLQACQSASAADTSKLNVLFIISDDLRTEPGCYGGLAKTPNIDALAATSVRFDRAYCQFPLCCPSRTSLLTGRYPLTTGVIGNRTWFGHEHPDYVSLPKYFQQHGYVTLRSGKIFHGGLDDTDAWTEGGQSRIYDLRGQADAAQRLDQRPATPRRQSDRWIVLPGNGERNGDYHAADRAIAFLDKYQDQPFFLGCGFANPHSPLTAPRRFYDMYDVDKIPLPPDFEPRPTVPPGFPPAAIRAKNADLFVGRDASPQEAKEMIRAYLAASSYLDWNVGRVLAELDRLGLREKTIIVFWGDHGYQLGEKGKWSKAGSLYEQGARVPLVVYDPHAAGNGKTCPRIVETLDLYPTLVELCGLPQPAGLQGRSLVPLLNDPDAEWNHPAFTIWSEDGRTATGISVRTDKWRYNEYTGPRGGALLFDEAADPHEMHNLAGDPQYADVCTRLAELIRRHKQQVGAAKPADETSRGPS